MHLQPIELTVYSAVLKEVWVEVICAKLWDPQHDYSTDLLERVQRRAMKMLREQNHLFYEEKLRVGIVQSGEV